MFISLLKNAEYIFWRAVALFVFIASWRLQVFAQGPESVELSDPASFETLVNPLQGIGVNSIPDLIEKILNFVVSLGAPVVALFIIYAGFLFVLAQGNEDKIKRAKRVLKNTLIGAVLVLGAFVIAKAIGGTIASLQ